MKDHDLTIHRVELPGTTALTSYTMEENRLPARFILSDEVDVIIYDGGCLRTGTQSLSDLAAAGAGQAQWCWL